MKKESNRIEKKSILITVLIQAVLIFGLFFAIAWKEPNPPIPQYGLELGFELFNDCLLYTSPSPRDRTRSRMPSSA